jgi:hypothetical protein
VRLAAAEKPKPVRKPSVQGCASCHRGRRGRRSSQPRPGRTQGRTVDSPIL